MTSGAVVLLTAHLLFDARCRHANERRIKSEEDPHALARSVLGLRILNSLRQEAPQRCNSLFHTCLVDSADLLQNGRQGKLFVHKVLVVEDLAQESDKIVVQYPSKSISISKLDDVQKFIESGLLLLRLRPTVSLDVISLVTSSCGYYRGHIEHHAAQ
jgi:hypothetical protein